MLFSVSVTLYHSFAASAAAFFGASDFSNVVSSLSVLMRNSWLWRRAMTWSRVADAGNGVRNDCLAVVLMTGSMSAAFVKHGQDY